MFGYDLLIACRGNGPSKAGLGYYYSVPCAVQNQLKVLAGTEYFSPNEVEVFYLKTSR